MDARKTFAGLILTVSFVFAFGTMAIASDIAFYVGGFQDGTYEQQAMTNDVEKIINDAGALFNDIQTFGDDNLEGLGQWVDVNTGDGELDIVWLNGAIPSTFYPTFNEAPDGSRAEEWLDDGNMIINVADYFAWATFETGIKERNTDTGAANILDLGEDIIESADDTQMVVTPTGKEFIPSLGDQLASNRPVNLDAIEDPWEAAAIFASVSGVDDQGAGGLADPVVLHNTETDGYLAVINQATTLLNMIDRGAACAEFINNWVFKEIVTPVESADKLSATWGMIKAAQ